MGSRDRGSHRRWRVGAATVATLSAAGLSLAGAQPIAAQGADPAGVRDQVSEVMSRPEFSYGPSILERFLDWLGDQLDKLFGSRSVGSSGTFGGGVGPLIAYLLIGVALAVAVAAVVYALRHRVRRVDDEEELSSAEIEHRRTATDWADDADSLEADGQYKEALRARYRQLVRTLMDRGQLPDVPGRTTGELRLDLDVTTPAAHEPFDTASLLFELVWYGDLPAGAKETGRFKALAAQALAAPVAGADAGLPSGPVGEGASVMVDR